MTRRTKRLLMGGLGLLVLLGGIGLTIHHSPFTIHRSVTKDVYYCPMHPTYTSDRPGDCPVCYMKLVKREPEAPEGGRTQPETRNPKLRRVQREISVTSIIVRKRTRGGHAPCWWWPRKGSM